MCVYSGDDWSFESFFLKKFSLYIVTLITFFSIIKNNPRIQVYRTSNDDRTSKKQFIHMSLKPCVPPLYAIHNTHTYAYNQSIQIGGKLFVNI